MVETTSNSNFKDEILEVIGEMPVSNTQKYRVLLVRDSIDGMIKISAQKWWRANTTSEWQVGKGFKLEEDQANTLGTLLIKAGNYKANSGQY